MKLTTRHRHGLFPRCPMCVWNRWLIRTLPSLFVAKGCGTDVERELDRARENKTAAARGKPAEAKAQTQARAYTGFRLSFNVVSRAEDPEASARRVESEMERLRLVKEKREAELRARHPDLAAIEGKDLDFTLTNMPGAPWVKAKWRSDAFFGVGWSLTIRLPCRLVEDPATETELQRDVFLYVDDVLRAMQLDERGPSALRAIGEVVRERLLFLYVHELNECLKLNGVRVRNPHPRSEFSYFRTNEYDHALDDQ